MPISDRTQRFLDFAAGTSWNRSRDAQLIRLSEEETAALKNLVRGNNTATQFIARACGHGKDLSKTRRLLKRMQGRGLVKGVEAQQSGRVFWWTITDQGLRALGIDPAHREI